MSDLISRKAAIDILCRLHIDNIAVNGKRITEFIRELPSVTDTNVGGKWILCNERLPKSEDKYGFVKCNVTVMRSHFPTSSYDSCDSPYDEYFVAGAMYDISQKIWHLGEHTQLNALIDIEDSPLNGDCVIAWMPLPEPMKTME